MKWKGLSLNSHFWLQLARLALFLLVLLFLCFVVWGKSQIRVQLMPLSYCEFTEERAMTRQQCLGDVNWLLLCSGMCIYSAMCPSCVPSLLHCHPSLISSSPFPRPPCYVSFGLRHSPPLRFYLLGTTYPHECVGVIPPESLRQTCLTILGGWGWVLFVMDLQP